MSMVRTRLALREGAAMRKNALAPPTHPQDLMRTTFQRLAENDDSLVSVQLDCEGMEQQDTQILADALSKNCILEELNAASCDLGDLGVRIMVEGLRRNPSSSLKRLNLSSNAIRFQGTFLLAMLLRQETKIESLLLHENQVGSYGITAFAPALQINANLKELVLSKNQINVEGATALGTALRFNETLTNLDLMLNQMGDDGMTAIIDGLRNNSSLRILNVTRNRIGVRGCFGLETALQTNRTLTELHMHGNDIGDDGAVAIANGLRGNRRLKILNVGANSIGDDGAAALASIISTCALTCLCMDCNQVCNEGAVSLAAGLQDDPPLARLNLHRNHFSIDGGTAILTCLKESNMVLEHVDIQCNKFEGCAAMSKEIGYYTHLNKSGRRLLRDSDLPSSIWPHVLEKTDSDVCYFFLQQKPDIFKRDCD